MTEEIKTVQPIKKVSVYTDNILVKVVSKKTLIIVEGKNQNSRFIEKIEIVNFGNTAMNSLPGLSVGDSVLLNVNPFGGTLAHYNQQLNAPDDPDKDCDYYYFVKAYNIIAKLE